jgi:large subunit ribosomal protein L24
MKKEWSRMWLRSVQPRKQRKYRHNAPLHVRHRFMSANLSPEMRRRFGKRSMAVRKGDEVEIMRGSSKGLRGTVNRIDLSRCKVYVDEVKTKKVDGSEVMKALEPSNLRITKLSIDDKMRERILERTGSKPGRGPGKEAREKEPGPGKAAGKKKAKKPAARKPAVKKESRKAAGKEPKTGAKKPVRKRKK